MIPTAAIFPAVAIASLIFFCLGWVAGVMAAYYGKNTTMAVKMFAGQCVADGIPRYETKRMVNNTVDQVYDLYGR